MFAALLDTITNSLNSQLVGGGLVLMLSGTALALLRYVPRTLWRFIQRQFVVRLDLAGDDSSFHWVTVWLNKHPYSKTARSVTVVTNHSNDDPRPQFVPAPGIHLIWYKRRPILLRRTRAERQVGNGYIESMDLLTFGRSPELLHDIVREAKDAYMRPTNDLRLFTSRQEHWEQVGMVRPRGLSTVILPGGVTESLVKDITEFRESREWYERRGVPWRRGYLLKGPPGTGKSSLIAALAGELGLDLYVPNLTSSGMTDEGFVKLLLNVPKGAAVLLEDIDAVVDGRDVKNSEGMQGSALTFSGLLNALDGVATRPGLLLFMTTNHPDKLDPALVRPGRIDQAISVGETTPDQAERLFRHFYELDLLDQRPVHFANSVLGRRCPSMAELQCVLIQHKHSPDEALRAVREEKLSAHLAVSR